MTVGARAPPRTDINPASVCSACANASRWHMAVSKRDQGSAVVLRSWRVCRTGTPSMKPNYVSPLRPQLRRHRARANQPFRQLTYSAVVQSAALPPPSGSHGRTQSAEERQCDKASHPHHCRCRRTLRGFLTCCGGASTTAVRRCLLRKIAQTAPRIRSNACPCGGSVTIWRQTSCLVSSSSRSSACPG